MTRWVWQLLASLGITGCSADKVEFHKLNIPSDKFANSNPKSPTLQEYYVVSNPPESVDSLARMAFSICRKLEPSRPESTFWIGRAFLKETRWTPRDFVEKEEDGGSIQTHGDDGILDINHGRTIVRECWFVSIRGREGPSPLDTCIDLAPPSRDSAKVTP